jgi:hypothetical protein
MQVLGLGRGDMLFSFLSSVHDWSGVLFVLSGLLHFALHWYVCMTKIMLKGNDKKKCS